jgi:hypothetical protein
MGRNATHVRGTTRALPAAGRLRTGMYAKTGGKGVLQLMPG